MKDFREWMEAGNEDQFEWTRNQLQKVKLLGSPYTPSGCKFTALADYMNGLAKRPEHQLFLQKQIIGNWASRASKKKSGKKSFGYQLKPSTHEALKRLIRKNETISMTLEKLIESGEAFRNELRYDYFEKLERRKKELEKEYKRKPRKRKTPEPADLLTEAKLEHLLNEKTKEHEALQSQYEALMLEACELMVLLEDAQVSVRHLSARQKSEAYKKREEIRKVPSLQLPNLLADQPDPVANMQRELDFGSS